MSEAAASRVFTRMELSAHDGDRGPAYVAYGAQVFDVSTSGEWRHGLHRNLHWAGQDLTDELVDAPHGVETLLRFPVVGTLAPEVHQAR
jgi:predicted heme/steroid binding protein